MNFSDMQITADEYFDILRKAWENSPYFDGWERKWHPEDLYSNFESVFDGVGEGLVAYLNIIGDKVRTPLVTPAALEKKRTGGVIISIDNDMSDEAVIKKVESILASRRAVDVFGGTLPRDYNKNVPTSGANTTAVGDNF